MKVKVAMTTRRRVLVLGGGFGGTYTARRLERRLPPSEAEIILVNVENYLLYTPLPPEAAAGTIEPRHVVVPLRQALCRTRVKVGTVTAVDLDRRTCTYIDAGGTERSLGWDRLADVAPQVLPELGGRLSSTALDVLRKRGVEIRLKTTLDQVGPDWARFSDGEWVPTSTVVWTAGVTPDPLIGKLGLPTDERGRLVVDEYLAVAGRDDVFAVGDVAAVPIAGRKGATAPPTAQHALRQARVCADNIAASLGHGERRPFAFRGLGLLVNLSENYGVGRVLGMPVSGVIGWMVTRTYHLFALPTWTRRLRVGLDWAVAAVFPRDVAELGTLGHPEPLPGEEAPPR